MEWLMFEKNTCGYYYDLVHFNLDIANIFSHNVISLLVYSSLNITFELTIDKKTDKCGLTIAMLPMRFKKHLEVYTRIKFKRINKTPN